MGLVRIVNGLEVIFQSVLYVSGNWDEGVEEVLSYC